MQTNKSKNDLNQKNLRDKIEKALYLNKNNSDVKKSIDKGFSTALSRIASELLVSLIIGGCFGFALDEWFKTKPLFMITFFLLGGIAGIYNLWRQVSGQGLKIGYFNKDRNK